MWQHPAVEVARLKLPKASKFNQNRQKMHLSIFPWDPDHPTADFLTQEWWMSEEAWLWLDLLNDCMSLPRGTSWVDHLLFYPPSW